MAEFINIPPLDIAEESEQWILTEDCIYQSDLNGDYALPELVVVPVGFTTDLASIPRIFRLLFVKNGKHRPAAIVHDWLCRLDLAFPRTVADKIFHEAMRVRGVGRMQARLMYWAVAVNTARLRIIGKARGPQ